MKTFKEMNKLEKMWYVLELIEAGNRKAHDYMRTTRFLSEDGLIDTVKHEGKYNMNFDFILTEKGKELLAEARA